jgi:hypothetical protein
MFMVKHAVASNWGELDCMQQSHERFDPRFKGKLFEGSSGS